MVIVDGIDQRLTLFGAFRVNITGNLGQNCPIERLRYDLAVEGSYIKAQFVIQKLRICDLTSHWIIPHNSITLFVVDALFAQFSGQLMGRIMVNQIPFDHSFTVCIFEYRLSKNFCCLQCWRCSQRNLHSVKVFHYTAVFTLVIYLVTVKDLTLAHLFI